MRRSLPSVLLVLGSVLVFLALPAGYVNRTVLDAPTFAERVDELRRRDDVSEVLGREVSQKLLKQNPDLVAIAPLVTQISIDVVGSDILSGPVRVAAAEFNRALTTPDSDQAILRIADIGAVVAGVIGALAPERAPRAQHVSVTLANVGDQTFATAVIDTADVIDTLAWLLPLLALACFLLAVLLAADRWDGVRRVGWSIVGAAAALAIVTVIGLLVARASGSGARADVLLDAVWDVFVRPIWWVIALLGVVGALLVMVGSGRAADWNIAGLTQRATRQPTTVGGAIVRALMFVGIGLAVLIEPQTLLMLAAIVAGGLLLVSGLGTLAGLAERPRDADTVDDDDTSVERSRGRIPVMVAAGIGVIALVSVTVWAARSPDNDVAGATGGAVTGTGDVCNGHAELCDRTFDDVSFAATHNSMSVAGKPGWFLGEQGRDIIPQLDSGVRALLVDVWYGRDAGNGAVRTSARSYEEALAVANEELGPEIVAAALRVVDAIAPGEPQGDEELYMCHGLCETGATSFDATLSDVRTWLDTHPDEVLSVFIEDHADASDIGAAVESAGLSDYLYTMSKGAPFPTIGEMIRSGRRLVVMLETGDGRPGYPWLVNGFEFVQETPYTFPTAESFNCDPNRGGPDAPLLQINHWLAGFSDLVSSVNRVNTADILGTRAEQCREERGLQPTFVAVNYADIGDLIAVVDQLNGVS